jgi:hypothetical protein
LDFSLGTSWWNDYISNQFRNSTIHSIALFFVLY